MLGRRGLGARRHRRARRSERVSTTRRVQEQGDGNLYAGAPALTSL